MQFRKAAITLISLNVLCGCLPTKTCCAWLSTSKTVFSSSNHRLRRQRVINEITWSAGSHIFLDRSIGDLSNGNSDDSKHSKKEASLATAAGLTTPEIARYSRHLVLPTVGVSGQVALKQAKVLVIGAGGLGSPCLLYLAAAGVGTIGIVDADIVDDSNLQRQVIHGTSTVGLSKCESAMKRIQDINPFVSVHLFQEEFTSETALRILRDTQPWDVVVDGSDNFPTKYLINDSCEILGISWVYSAILGFEGQISVFNFKGGPTYRDLLPTPPDPGAIPSCAEGGVLGVLPGVMGVMQATEVIKILLGKESGLLSGRVLVYDALQMKFLDVSLQKNASRELITELIDYQGFCAGPKTAVASTARTSLSSNDSSDLAYSGVSRVMDEAEHDKSSENSTADLDSFHCIEPKECVDKLLSGWSPWVLDVRLLSEHQIVALPFTDKVVPHREVHLDSIPKSGPILVYCKGGVRGKKACRRLIELGVDPKRLHNLTGGIMKWQTDVDSSLPRY